MKPNTNAENNGGAPVAIAAPTKTAYMATTWAVFEAGETTVRRALSPYRASHDDYQDSFLPTGHTAGSPEEALDCACGLYLGEPTAWVEAITDTPTN